MVSSANQPVSSARFRYSRTKGTTVTPAARASGSAAASCCVPLFGRLFATIARTPLRCMRAKASVGGTLLKASSL